MPGKTIDQQIVDKGKSGGGEEMCVHNEGKGSTDEGSTSEGKGSTDEGKGSTGQRKGVN